MSNSEGQTEPPVRTFQSITGNGRASPTLTHTHTNGSRIHRSNTSSSRVHRTTSSNSHKESKDPNLDVNFPYRTFSDAANLKEYTQEKPEGEIPGPVEPNGKDHYKLVTFVPNDPANPKNWSKAFKWYCTMVGKRLRSKSPKANAYPRLPFSCSHLFRCSILLSCYYSWNYWSGKRIPRF